MTRCKWLEPVKIQYYDRQQGFWKTQLKCHTPPSKVSEAPSFLCYKHQIKKSQTKLRALHDRLYLYVRSPLHAISPVVEMGIHFQSLLNHGRGLIHLPRLWPQALEFMSSRSLLGERALPHLPKHISLLETPQALVATSLVSTADPFEEWNSWLLQERHRTLTHCGSSGSRDVPDSPEWAP